MSSTSTVEPGRYEYRLSVKFPSVYIPEHMPAWSRNAAAMQTTRTRETSGDLVLHESADRDAICAAIVRKDCDDLFGQQVQVAAFELTPTA